MVDSVITIGVFVLFLIVVFIPSASDRERIEYIEDVECRINNKIAKRSKAQQAAYDVRVAEAREYEKQCRP